MPANYSIWGVWVLAALLAAPAAAQQAPPTSASRSYTIFFRGTPIGREQLTVRPDATGITISGESRMALPVNFLTRHAEIRYRTDWTPESFVLDASIDMADLMLRTTFANGTATSEGTNAGRPIQATQPMQSRTLILADLFFGAYEALGRLFVDFGTGGTFHAFSGPGTDVPFRVLNTATERMQAGTSTFNVRRYELLFTRPDGDININLSTDEAGGLIRVSVPVQGIDVIREDVATSTARTQIFSNPGDEAVVIPSVGFNLGATITRPKASAAAGASPGSPGSGGPSGPPTGPPILPTRFPAVVLLSDSGANDRDGYAAGVPIVGQLAGAMADAGFLSVRYDKRGTGQSGGRAESATLSDFADDASVVVKWLQARKDVDPKRIAVLGHGEGAWVALLAAGRDNRIAAVVALAAPSTTGAELVLEQQLSTLDRLNVSPGERQEKIALQKKIHSAVVSGTGWEGVPPEMRRQADTPWFQSLLAFDPAKVIRNVRQPMLFLHGQIDRQIPVEHVERIANLARTTSKSKSVEVVTVRGANHLLVPAVTGEAAEYGTLPSRNVSPDVTTAITGWLSKTSQTIK